MGETTDKPSYETCMHNADVKPHTCPFKEDVNDDYESLCRCCKDCEEQCAWDI